MISAAELEAHRGWVERGGEGRLVVRDRVIVGQSFAGHTLAGAIVERGRFDDVSFGDAVLDDAVFTDCDLRGADFAVIPLGPGGTTARTRFERCDLRGTIWIDRSLASAVFVDCKLQFARGRPRDVDAIEVTRPDLSIAGDGSQIATASEVLDKLWQATGPAPPLDAEDKRVLRDMLKRQWTQRQQPAKPRETQPCPLCDRPVPKNPRYPRYVFGDCLDLVTDRRGRRVEFANEGFSGGFVGNYAGTDEPYDDHECFVRGVRCRADEAKFGGIVYELDGDARLQVIDGDITTLAVDAIVNAANRSLLGGGGVDGAIHLAAGPELLDECRALGGCEVGDAKITRGYQLPATWVIHTVGPRWSGGDRGEEASLARCYRRSLAIARERGLATVAFPLISTGAFGYPLDQAVRVAVTAIANALPEGPLPRRVTLCAFGDDATRAVVTQLAAHPRAI